MQCAPSRSLFHSNRSRLYLRFPQRQPRSRHPAKLMPNQRNTRCAYLLPRLIPISQAHGPAFVVDSPRERHAVCDASAAFLNYQEAVAAPADRIPAEGSGGDQQEEESTHANNKSAIGGEHRLHLETTATIFKSYHCCFRFPTSSTRFTPVLSGAGCGIKQLAPPIRRSKPVGLCVYGTVKTPDLDVQTH